MHEIGVRETVHWFGLTFNIETLHMTWLTMFISLIVGFAFNILKLFEVAPKVTENQVMEIVSQVLTFLGLIGVLVDPTTNGLGDSQRALGYEEPWVDEGTREE